MKRSKGVIYGAIIADLLANQFPKDYSNGYTLDWRTIDFGEELVDWSSATDQIILLAKAINDEKDYINICQFAELLQEWRERGFIDLPNRSKKMSMMFNHIVAKKQYVNNPIKVAYRAYVDIGGESATNESLVRSCVCAIKANWYKNTMLQSLITDPDSRCTAAAVLHAYIINRLLLKIPIVWKEIFIVCNGIIVTQKKHIGRNQSEFRGAWDLANGYKLLLQKNSSEPFLDFFKKQNVGNLGAREMQNQVLLTMLFSMVICFDIEHELKNGRKINGEYYVKRVKQTISLGGDVCANSIIVGSIIGAIIGTTGLPLEWLEYAEHYEWLIDKMKPISFADISDIAVFNTEHEKETEQ